MNLLSRASIRGTEGPHHAKSTTLQQAFEDQALKTPNNIALVYQGTSLTYQALNEKSNQLARLIRRRYQALNNSPLKPDTLIGLCVERSHDMIVGLLAILKAGGAYVPLDPDYPKNRLEYMMNDSNQGLVITQKNCVLKHPSLISDNDKNLLILDNTSTLDELELCDKHNLFPQSTERHLCYVIYTSGSTGRPKGVMIEHRSVINFCEAQSDLFQISQQDRTLYFAPFSFDVSTAEIFFSLLNGSSLYIASSHLRKSPENIIEFMLENKINFAALPPALLSVLPQIDLPDLKILMVGGEKTQKQAMQFWSQGRLLMNAYGPTEGTVAVSMHAFQYDDLETNIGKSIRNIQFYILDKNHKQCPDGEIGELYIGGTGLARGYLHHPDLTADTFIANPFAEELLLPTTDRIYQTGDLVKRLPNGDLQYIGRNNTQIKIRGFRVELGEIENVLESYSDITQACVVTKEKSTGIVLNAYFVTDKDQTQAFVDKLRKFMSENVPNYMIPNEFYKVDTMPLTPNGKIDRKSLLQLGRQLDTANDDKSVYTELQKELIKIWRDNLDLDQVGIDDNYFMLGGNSLSVIAMLGAVNAVFGTHISVSSFLQQLTIRSLATCISRGSLNPAAYKNKVLSLITQDSLPPNVKKYNVKDNPYINQPRKILVTGTTGFLGSYLVDALCQKNTATIYCLVRASNREKAIQKQNEAFKKNGLKHLINHSKIKIIIGDLEKPQLGASDEIYRMLITEIDTIYHNGAFVHHIYGYERLRKANVLSTKTLIELALSYKRKALHFISTISVSGFNIDTIESYSGYVVSKWVSEQLLRNSEQRGLVYTIQRPGNITGHSKTGFCQPEKNHILLKVKGSVQIKQSLFTTDEVIDMMPVDILSNYIASCSLGENDSINAVEKNTFNLCNPCKVNAKKYMDTIARKGYQFKWTKNASERLTLLNSIDVDNSFYSLKSLYESSSLQLTDSLLKAPSSLPNEPGCYEKMIALQVDYLLSINFLN